MTRFFFNKNKQNQNKKWSFFISFISVVCTQLEVRPLLERQSKGTNILYKTVISLLVYQP